MAGHMTEPVVVCLPAEIDIINCEAVCEQLCSACAPGVTIIIADLTSTTFCDCAALSRLANAHRVVADCGAQLRLAVSHPSVVRILDLTGLARMLPVYPSLSAAVAGSPAIQ